MASVQNLGNLVIPNGTSVSNVMTKEVFGRCRSLSLMSLDAALTNVVTLAQGASDNATFKTVQSPSGTDVALAASKAVILLAVPFGSIRLIAAGNEAGTRTWEVWGEVGE